MKLVVGNFDGDASWRDDIGVVYNDGPGNFSFRILIATGSPGSPTFAELATLMWDSGPWRWCWEWGGYPFAADFDNDGRTDVASFYRVNICHAQLVPFYGNADRTMTIPAAPAWDSGPNTWCPLRTAVSVSDVNADGQPDLTAVYHCCLGYQVKVYTFTASGRTFGAPVLRWAGSIGPAGTRVNE